MSEIVALFVVLSPVVAAWGCIQILRRDKVALCVPLALAMIGFSLFEIIPIIPKTGTAWQIEFLRFKVAELEACAAVLVGVLFFGALRAWREKP